MLTVAEIMTREPYTLGPDNSLQEARTLMAEHHIRHVPVVSAEGNLVGVVSQRDVLAASSSSLMAGSSVAGDMALLSTIMTTPVQTVSERADLRGAAIHLQKNKLGCLPVVSSGKLVGIVTDSDYVGVAINLMEQLELSETQESNVNEDLDGL
jgi:CBS domain-containing membrane protein